MTSARLKTVNRFADRGAYAEKAVKDYLTEWGQHPRRDWARLVDAKAAGRLIKAAAADFEFLQSVSGCGPKGDEVRSCYGLIEVKETKHDYRLEKKRVTQMARLRKRSNAGAVCLVAVFHSTSNTWRGLPVKFLAQSNETTGSWDLRDVPAFPDVQGALHYAACGVF